MDSHILSNMRSAQDIIAGIEAALREVTDDIADARQFGTPILKARVKELYDSSDETLVNGFINLTQIVSELSVHLECPEPTDVDSMARQMIENLIVLKAQRNYFQDAFFQVYNQIVANGEIPSEDGELGAQINLEAVEMDIMSRGGDPGDPIVSAMRMILAKTRPDVDVDAIA